MRVGILGGGIAGLTAAWELTRAEIPVTIFEAAERCGGQIRTERVGGFVIEHGAEGVGHGGRATADLCHALDLDGHVLSQRARQSWILRGARLDPLPPGEAATRLGIRAHPGDLGRGLWTLRDGMGALVDALVDAIEEDAELVVGVPVIGLSPIGGRATRGGGWHVSLADGTDRSIDLLLAAVAPAQLAPLCPCSPSVVTACSGFHTVSSVTVTLAFPEEAVQSQPAGSGFVVSGEQVAETGFMACTFSSSKFSHRVPEGAALFRLFARPREAELEAEPPLPPEVWRDRAMRLLEQVLGTRAAAPVLYRVSSWAGAIPRYAPETVRRVETLRRRLAALGPVQLAGAGYEPSGIDGAVRSGRRAARRIIRLAARVESFPRGRPVRG